MIMVQHARFTKSQALLIAQKLHQKVGAVALGAMSILASATAPQTSENQITLPPPLIKHPCTTPMRHVALQMIILLQSAPLSWILPHATLRTNALTQEVHVAWMRLV
jgi:hypothetical protein